MKNVGMENWKCKRIFSKHILIRGTSIDANTKEGDVGKNDFIFKLIIHYS